MTKLRSFLEMHSSVRGSFNDISALLWDQLLLYQESFGCKGDHFEIGVQFGRSALMILEHAQADEAVYLCDRYFRDEAMEVLSKRRSENVHYLSMSSTSLNVERHLGKGRGSFRWVHIDGHHSASVFSRDLELCAELVNDDGILVIDDFMSNQYPQITYELFRYLHAHPAKLRLFLTGYNKGYLCRPLALRRYMTFLKNSLYDQCVKNGYENLLIYKSTHPDDFNCFGITPGFNGKSGYQGPDWDYDAIDI